MIFGNQEGHMLSMEPEEVELRNSGSGNVDIPLPFLLGICPNNEKKKGLSH